MINLRLSSIQNGKQLKICLKLTCGEVYRGMWGGAWRSAQRSLVAPLNQWLLGATNSNQGQTVMDLSVSETINHTQWV